MQKKFDDILSKSKKKKILKTIAVNPTIKFLNLYNVQRNNLS